VSEDIGWLEVVGSMTQESFARGVLWLCRDIPQLAKMATRSGLMAGGSSVQAQLQAKRQAMEQFSDTLLDEIYCASTTRHLLYSFHCCFLRLMTSPHGANLSEIALKYDRTMGLPPRYMKQRMLKMLEKASRASNYDEYFDTISMTRVSSETLKGMWLLSLRSSFRNGYHSLNTDFSRIQSRGVSNILLRGKSFPRVVFCIDTSGSMGSEFVDRETNRRTSRLEYVKEELAGIFASKLTHRNQFSIVEFNSEAVIWSKGLQQATAASLDAASKFVRNWYPTGGTNYPAALHTAFSVPGVEAVYLLSDGEVWGDAELLSLVRRLSRNGEIQCNTTAFFAPESGQQLLKAIADATNGSYVKFGDDTC
jgi:Mg-chelatase subunit ChlD